MLNRLPETLPLLDLDERDDDQEEVGVPHNNSEASEGETSPDDPDGAGEEENAEAVVLQPMITFGSCSGCGQQAFAALLGRPDALVVFEQLLLSEKLNLLCFSCGEDLEPSSGNDD